MEKNTKDQQPLAKQAWEAPQVINLGADKAEGKTSTSIAERTSTTFSYAPS